MALEDADDEDNNETQQNEDVGSEENAHEYLEAQQSESGGPDDEDEDVSTQEDQCDAEGETVLLLVLGACHRSSMLMGNHPAQNADTTKLSTEVEKPQCQHERKTTDKRPCCAPRFILATHINNNNIWVAFRSSAPRTLSAE